MLTRAIMRSVWLRSATPSTGAGVVVQVPTQCMLSCFVIDLPPARHPDIYRFTAATIGNQPSCEKLWEAVSIP
jgi:hypothetical protein